MNVAVKPPKAAGGAAGSGATDVVDDGLPAGFRRLWRQLSARRRRHFAAVMLLMFAGAFAELLTIGAVLPFLVLISDPARAEQYPFLMPFLRALSPGDDILVAAAGLFIIIAVVAGAVRIMLARASQHFVFRLGYDLALKAMRHSLSQDYSYHVMRNSSEGIALINMTQIVITQALLPLMLALTASVIALCILASLLLVDAGIALSAGITFALVYVVITIVMKGRLRRNSVLVAQAQAERIKIVQESLGGIRDVLIDGTQEVYVAKFAAVDSRFRDAQASNALISATPRFVIEAFGMVLIAILAVQLSARPGGFTAAIPILGALAIGSQRLLPLLQQVYAGWTAISGNRRVLFEVLRILELPMPAHRAVPRPDALPFARAITVRDVGFRYPGTERWVLRHVDQVIAKGERIGLIGKTGSGKSTVMDMVMALLEPSEGAILVDDAVVKGETAVAWQAQIAHVPQAIFLSDATIAENIAIGLTPGEIDHERVRYAATQARLTEFVEALPAGFATMVGERGVRLSGGQRQRIGIARALYKKPRLLVFDEATSALDSETEAEVMDAIYALGRELTIVVIAHRLSTIERCDRLFRVEDGQLVQAR